MAVVAVCNSSINIYSINNNNSITGVCVRACYTFASNLNRVFFLSISRSHVPNVYVYRTHSPINAIIYTLLKCINILLRHTLKSIWANVLPLLLAALNLNVRLLQHNQTVCLLFRFVRSFVHFTITGGGGVQQPRWSYCTNTNRANDWRQICYPRTLWYTSR